MAERRGGCQGRAEQRAPSRFGCFLRARWLGQSGTGRCRELPCFLPRRVPKETGIAVPQLRYELAERRCQPDLRPERGEVRCAAAGVLTPFRTDSKLVCLTVEGEPTPR